MDQEVLRCSKECIFYHDSSKEPYTVRGTEPLRVINSGYICLVGKCLTSEIDECISLDDHPSRMITPEYRETLVEEKELLLIESHGRFGRFGPRAE